MMRTEQRVLEERREFVFELMRTSNVNADDKIARGLLEFYVAQLDIELAWLRSGSACRP